MGITLRIFFIFLIYVVFTGFSSAEEEDERPLEIGYIEMKPSIVSNLTGGPKYIRCDIQLMTKYAEDVPHVHIHMPALRHSVLMLIAGADGRLLTTPEGKEGLRVDALKAIQETLTELTEEPRVNDLFFTAYYVK